MQTNKTHQQTKIKQRKISKTSKLDIINKN